MNILRKMALRPFAKDSDHAKKKIQEIQEMASTVNEKIDELSTKFEEADEEVVEIFIAYDNILSRMQEVQISKANQIRDKKLKDLNALETQCAHIIIQTRRLTETSNLAKKQLAHSAPITAVSSFYSLGPITWSERIPTTASHNAFTIHLRPCPKTIPLHLRKSLDEISLTHAWAYAGFAPINFPIENRKLEEISSHTTLQGTPALTVGRGFGIDSNPYTNTLYLTLQESNTVAVCSKDLTVIRSIKKPTPAFDEMSMLLVAAVSPLGRVAIVANSNSAVYVFEHDLEFIMACNTSPEGRGGPISAAFDSTENLYVSDHSNGTITKFSRDGEILASIAASQISQVSSIYALMVDDQDRVLSLQYAGSSVLVLSSELEFVKTIDIPPTGDFNSLSRGPQNGFLVTDYQHNQLHMFTSDGVLLTTLKVQGSPTAACFLDGRVYVMCQQDRCVRIFG
eukprot:TRINITY_DN6336_c0_g1_i1.p1 TRINITY_DN6336_c0_g1~~TRINITY_DN6336_c0_g1_i1.p1  ORF type:complete len:454 (-),score=102.72 TRINITY_DN6336_c0_g1_i1:171-1532(-)